MKNNRVFDSIRFNEVIKSISFSQEEIISNIVKLHTGPIQCDVTYGSGCFYKNGIKKPAICFDIFPHKCGVIKADVKNLPLKDSSISCIMFDPPFLIRTGEGSLIKNRFGSIKGNISDLLEFYYKALGETYRVLKRNGWLIFKCQDFVSGGKNHFIHCDIRDMALSRGFEVIDMFILGVLRRMPDPQGRKQRHARKYHSYFWVMQKTNRISPPADSQAVEEKNK